jgi:hypothetical protein
MTRWMPAAAALTTLAIATSAFAADGAVSLSKISGGVLVNQGHGFRPASAGMVLHPGDRVLVTVNGGAGLTWSGGCGVKLGGGSLATISSATPCTAGAHNAGIVTANVASNERGGGGGPIGILKGLGSLGGGGSSESP